MFTERYPDDRSPLGPNVEPTICGPVGPCTCTPVDPDPDCECRCHARSGRSIIERLLDRAFDNSDITDLEYGAALRWIGTRS